MSINKRKESFSRIIRGLAHPAVILSMALLFLNDYVFRVVSPSGLTGKLGDFAWLFFFPYFITAILVWVLPKKWLKKDTPILIGIGLTVVVFSLGKTTPFFLHFIIDSLETIFPWRVGWVVDPTDLIALPMLLLTYLLWVKLPASQPASRTRASWLWLGVAAFVLLGDAAIPPSGIVYLDVIDGEVYVGDNFHVYRGKKGGLEWVQISSCSAFAVNEEDCIYTWTWNDPIKQIADPDDDDIQYRFNTGESIERSADGGKTWATEFELLQRSEALEAYYHRGGQTGYSNDVPYDAGFDPETGNLIMTMKFDGLLVRTAKGDYEWVPISNYYHTELNFYAIISLLLPGDLALALFLGVVCISIFRWKGSKWYWKVVTSVLFAGTIALGAVLQPARSFMGYGRPFVLFPVLVGGIVSLILFINSIRKMRRVGFVVLTGIVVSAIHLIPMFLWGYNILPYYRLAFGLGVSLSAGWTVYRFIQYNKLDEPKDKELEAVQP